MHVDVCKSRPKMCLGLGAHVGYACLYTQEVCIIITLFIDN